MNIHELIIDVNEPSVLLI